MLAFEASRNALFLASDSAERALVAPDNSEATTAGRDAIVRRTAIDDWGSKV
jgi:hypothetical protein